MRRDQRESPYITHPLLVAQILWETGGIRETAILTTAILHDTIEDTSTSPDELQSRFGAEVLRFVPEVTDDKSLPKIERKRRRRCTRPTIQAGQVGQAERGCGF